MQLKDESCNQEKILKIDEVVEITKISRSEIYRLIQKNAFPKQLKLTAGGKASGWLESEVQQYISSRSLIRGSAISGGWQR